MTEKDRQVFTGPISINTKGVGFFDIEGYDDSIEIQPQFVNRALHGDTVEISLIGEKIRNRDQGKVERVVKRAKDEFVGVVEVRDGKTYVVPDDKRLYVDIPLPHGEKADVGNKVLVKIMNWETLESKILKVIGKKGENNTEMESIVLEKGFRIEFPPEVLREAEDIREKYEAEMKGLSGLDAVQGENRNERGGVQKYGDESISVSNKEMRQTWKSYKDRRDMRGITTMTIDPIDAKDFDDAISFQDLGDNKFEIGIHIADVSYFVTPGSSLDRESEKRGLSVYLVDRTIPMLPEVLSNDLCSLNPNEDKFTFSAIFKMTNEGEVLEEWFGRTVIHSDRRFSYEDAQEVIDGKQPGPYQTELRKLREIAQKLEKKKINNGAMVFETEEVKFELDSAGKPIRVYKKSRLDTHKLVEEFMLLANRAVAKFVFLSQSKNILKKGSQSVYRIHPSPDTDRIENLAIFLKAMGFNLKNKDGVVTSKDLNALLKEVKGTPNEELINTATIRSMAKATYSTKNIGHFSLAFVYYTHFTSPIRRYPDVLVHRFLERELKGGKIEQNEYEKFEAICLASSELEKKASDAERTSIKYKQVEYMLDHVGETFFGTITGVTEWGIYVEEKETKCEGMVKIRDIGDDFYVLDEKNYTLKGEKTGRKFTLGDTVKFKITAADMERRALDYQIMA